MSKETSELSMTMTPEKRAALAAAVRADLCETDKMHLDQLEQRILDHRERFTLSLLEIGRCLNEAKDAGLVPHGCWQDWVAVNTGFTLRGAQRMMKAAREIPKTSTLTLLDFSKVSALLALPADQREDFAKETDAEHISVRQLEQAIREKKEVEEKLRRANDETAVAYKVVAKLDAQVASLKNRLDDAISHPQVVEREVLPADYDEIKFRDMNAEARIQEAENYAVEQEALVRELQRQLDEAKMGAVSQIDESQAFISACATFYGEVCRYQDMDDMALLRGRTRADLAAMETWVSMIRSWADALAVRLRRPVVVEVDGNAQ